MLKFAAVAATMAATATLFNSVVPEPFMDEIFHFRQSQEYCKSNWHVWDDKITTLPGVYLVAVSLFNIFSKILGMTTIEICTLSNMRLVNIMFGMFNLALIHSLLKENATKQEEKSTGLRSMALFLFPVMFFFYFMFYTDAGGLFFVLLTLLCFKRSYATSLRVSSESSNSAKKGITFDSINKTWILAAAISGLAAILFRQTNVIWVIFGAASTLLEIFESQSNEKAAEGALPTLPSLMAFINFALRNLVGIVLVFWPVLLTGACFGLFLVWNGSITVGDKTAHAAVFHWPQILYFLLFSTILLAWRFVDGLFTNIGAFSRHLASLISFRRPLDTIIIIGFLILNVFFISRFTYAHLYLISDNRHYTFYVWKKIFERFAMAKFFLLSAYYLAAWFIFGKLLAHKSSLWKLVFIGCTAATVVPAQLIEFRYFIIPFNILAINSKDTSTNMSYWVHIAEILGLVAVNAATIFVFLYRPYAWPDGSTARFMW